MAVGRHAFRAIGITGHLENGGTIENARAVANHDSPKTTQLTDRTSDQIALDPVERIVSELKFSHFLPESFRISTH